MEEKYNCECHLGDDLSKKDLMRLLLKRFAHRNDTIAILANSGENCERILKLFWKTNKIMGYYVPEIKKQEPNIDYIFQNAKNHDAIIMNLNNLPIDDALKIKKEAQKRYMQILTFT